MWLRVRQGLRHEVVAPNLYQLGASLEEWAEGVLRAAGRGPLVVVGNSVGGSCAIEVARLAPAAVRHLVLVGAKPGHRPEPAYRDAAVRLLESGGMPAAWPVYWEPLLGPVTSPAVADAVRTIGHAQRVDDVIRGVRAFHGRRDRSRFLLDWPGPVTVVSGEYDIAPQRSRDMASSLRDGRYVLVPGVGHYVPLEDPAAMRDVIAQAVDEASCTARDCRATGTGRHHHEP